MSVPRARRHLVMAISATFVLSLLLRLWNIRWGWPFNYHPDEHVVYDNAVLMVRTGELNPGWFHWPSLIFYLELGVVQVVRWVSDSPLLILQGEAYSPGMMARDQWGYLTVGRLAVALMGAAAAAVVAATAGRIGQCDARARQVSWVPALMAGFTIGLAPLHVEHSHFLTPDVPATLGVAVALYAAISMATSGATAGRALIAGLGVGLGAGFKYTACLAAVAVAVGALSGAGSRTRRILVLCLAAVVSVLAFVASTPYAVLDFQTFWSGLVFDHAHYTGGHAGHTVDSAVVAMAERLWRVDTLGPVALVIAGIAGLVLLARDARHPTLRPTLVALSFVMAYGLLFLTARADFDRSSLPLVPAIALLVGSAAAGLMRLCPSEGLARLVGVALLLALLPQGLAATSTAHELGLPRTQTLAHDWFEGHVPENALVEREWYTPHLSPQRFQVKVHPTFSSVRWAHRDPNLDYVVLSSKMFRRWAEVSAGTPDSLAEPRARYETYGQVFRERVVQVFCPVPGEVTGPEIWIFAVSERASRLHSEVGIYGSCRSDWPWLRAP